MAEVQLNILICGVTSDTSSLFIALYNYLKCSGHNVNFIIPEYSGAVCLINKNVPFISLEQVKPPCDSDSDLVDNVLLEKCINYDLKQTNFNSKFIRKIKYKRLLRNAKLIYQSYNSYLREKKFDLIITWGGIRYYSSIPASIAKRNGIKCVFIEKGLFPFTLQIDSNGVNAASNLRNEFGTLSNENEFYSLAVLQARLKEPWYFNQPLNEISSLLKIKYLIKHFGWSELFIKIYHKYFETKLLGKFVYKDNWKVNDPFSTSDVILNQDFVFIPFQVSDDSQLLVQGDWLDNNIDLVKSVYKGLKESGLETKIVVKEHPREYINYDFKKKLTKYNIYFSGAGTLDLINKSKLVVTINSTAGFEALVFNKPVVITGNALYESIPLVTKCNSQKELTSSLKTLLMSDKKNDENLVNKYVSAVFNKLIKCDYVNASGKEVEDLWTAISGIIQN